MSAPMLATMWGLIVALGVFGIALELLGLARAILRDRQGLSEQDVRDRLYGGARR